MIINLCLVTRNKALNVTSLHTAMNLNMYCMSKGIHLEITFVHDRSVIFKQMKNCDRLIWIDYGTSIDMETLQRMSGDLPDGYKVVIAPCVLEGVDWAMFKKKTIENSTEPSHQRGLKFDTVVVPTNKQVAEFVSSTSDGRVFAIDTKPVLKKLRDAECQYKSMEHLKKLGVKIGVLKECSVTCHYVYESVGNIMESSGVRMSP